MLKLCNLMNLDLFFNKRKPHCPWIVFFFFDIFIFSFLSTFCRWWEKLEWWETIFFPSTHNKFLWTLNVGEFQNVQLQWFVCFFFREFRWGLSILFCYQNHLKKNCCQHKILIGCSIYLTDTVKNFVNHDSMFNGKKIQ